jgi:penicillin-binding protein 1A
MNPFFKKFLLTIFSLSVLAALSAGLLGTLVVALIYPNLPSLDHLSNYHPKIPLRIFSIDGELIGEFGEERRLVMPIQDIPTIMKQAILAAEDDNFYHHKGVDYSGMARALINNLTGGAKQGASTITMQIARNFFLSSEKSYTRKLYEIMLTLKIEHSLPKDKILELYMNQIYLGQRAYGFATAAQIYYGKPLKDITVAEAAMLAGLPKAPSAYNPVVNPKRARVRQLHILGRLRDLGWINAQAYDQAIAEKQQVRTEGSEFNTRAEYASEMARQIVYDAYKEETYTRGLNVYTTIHSKDQQAAWQALRKGLLDYTHRYGYDGPEAFFNIPNNKPLIDVLDDALIEHPDSHDLYAALVIDASPKMIKVMRANGDELTLQGEGIRFAANSLSDKASPQKRIRRGAIIRIKKDGKSGWEISQIPEVEGGIVAINSDDGSVRAMVGGFDFNRNKFNHVTQAWRQPGSSFKPFIYSAALEKGFYPGSIVQDAPISIDGSITGGAAWEPKNYDGKFEGAMKLSTALAKSKNMVSIRLLQTIGAKQGQDYITKFGFEAAKHPAYLTMALGAGSVTIWQMAGGYSVFANGGYRINPYLIHKITDATGNVLAQAQPAKAGNESIRAIDPRNAWLMNGLMQGVVRNGTAAKAYAQFKRNDMAGKTGTTNDSHDAWFAGYVGKVVAVSWVGYDQPKKLGDKETGGGLALPIWMNYITKVLPTISEVSYDAVPAGLVQVNGDYMYEENQGHAINTLSENADGGNAVETLKKEEVRNQLF